MLNWRGGPGLLGILASNTLTTGSANSSVGADVSYGLRDFEVIPTDTICISFCFFGANEGGLLGSAGCYLVRLLSFFLTLDIRGWRREFIQQQGT